MTIAHHTLEVIGTIHSPYRQKFAIPRQPGLVTAATATIELQGAFAHPDCVRGLAEFSHIWVLFLFHQTIAGGWKPLVRPPRLGGDVKKGVFASRATYRPNGIGMSVLQLKQIESDSDGTRIIVQGADLVDGTPIIDIKPYLPYSDALPMATGGYADSRPQTELTTRFSDVAQAQLAQFAPAYPQLAELIDQVLRQDPRPAYKRSDLKNKTYGMNLFDLNIKWQVIGTENHVISITKDF